MSEAEKAAERLKGCCTRQDMVSVVQSAINAALASKEAELVEVREQLADLQMKHALMDERLTTYRRLERTLLELPEDANHEDHMDAIRNLATELTAARQRAEQAEANLTALTDAIAELYKARDDYRRLSRLLDGDSFCSPREHKAAKARLEAAEESLARLQLQTCRDATTMISESGHNEGSSKGGMEQQDANN